MCSGVPTIPGGRVEADLHLGPLRASRRTRVRRVSSTSWIIARAASPDWVTRGQSRACGRWGGRTCPFGQPALQTQAAGESATRPPFPGRASQGSDRASQAPAPGRSPGSPGTLPGHRRARRPPCPNGRSRFPDTGPCGTSVRLDPETRCAGPFRIPEANPHADISVARRLRRGGRGWVAPHRGCRHGRGRVRGARRARADEHPDPGHQLESVRDRVRRLHRGCLPGALRLRLLPQRRWRRVRGAHRR